MVRGGAAAVAAAVGLAGLGYYLVVTGKLTIDTGWGRRVRPLGRLGVEVADPARTVFDVIAAPYLGRTPRAMSGKLQVLERGAGMVLAEHYTPVHRGRLTAATLETVTFDRPHRVAAAWEAAVRASFTSIQAEQNAGSEPVLPIPDVWWRRGRNRGGCRVRDERPRGRSCG